MKYILFDLVKSTDIYYTFWKTFLMFTMDTFDQKYI